jgi:plastocyanin
MMPKQEFKPRRPGVIVLVAATGLIAGSGAAWWLSSAARSAEPMMDHHRMGAMQMNQAIQTIAAAPNQIVIDDFAFGPQTLTVAAGTEVIWVNHDDEPHTVVASGETKLFKSPALDTGDKYSYVFAEKGTYKYYCSIHPHMTGTVVVQ